MRPQRLSGPSALLQGRGPGGVEPSAACPSSPQPRVAEGPPGVPGAPGRPPLRLHSSTSSGGGGQTQPSGWGPPAVPSAAAHSVRKAHDFVLEEGEVTLNVAVWRQLPQAGGRRPPCPVRPLGEGTGCVARGVKHSRPLRCGEEADGAGLWGRGGLEAPRRLCDLVLSTHTAPFSIPSCATASGRLAARHRGPGSGTCVREWDGELG